MPFVEKLMPFPSARISTPATASVLLIIALSFLMGGCGGRPWAKIVDEQARETLIAEYLRYSATVAQCKLPLAAEALIDAHTRFEQQLFTGSLEIMPPHFLRFTTYNPLGQPVIILTSRGDIFQAIDVFERRYRAGRLRSFALRYELPPHILTGPWYHWLTGQPPDPSLIVNQIRTDRDDRGVWFEVSSRDKPAYREQILVDLSMNTLVERAVINADGKTVATISYQDWHLLESCSFPRNITISGLTFGAGLTVELTDLSVSERDETRFTLKAPPGYLRTIYP